MTHIRFIDTKGHNSYTSNSVIDLENTDLSFSEKSHWQRLATLYANMNKFSLLIKEKLGTLTAQTCFECGKEYQFIRKGDTLVAHEECSHPGGLEAYSCTLSVPSGRIVFENDLRSLVDIDQTNFHRTALGRKKEAEAFAEKEIMYSFVGNTCPDIFETKDEIIVSNGVCNPDDFGPDEKIPSPMPFEADIIKKHGNICTNLWAVCAMDYDLFLQKCLEQKKDPEFFNIIVVDVEPGVYSFTHEKTQGDDERSVYSYIRKTNDVSPTLTNTVHIPTANSFSESEIGKEITSLQNNGVFGQNKMSLLGYILCTTGNGYVWFKGHLKSRKNVNKDTPFISEKKLCTTEFSSDFIPSLTLPENALTKGWTPKKLKEIPFDIDVYTLAAALIFVKSKITEAEKNKLSEQDGQEFINALNILLEISHLKKFIGSEYFETILLEVSTDLNT
jgi:hypothetical protein